MAEDAPRKRSRFDQTEPDRPPRPSRFDRRSRSPAPRKPSETFRSRSPVSRNEKSPSAGLDPASAAAAAAARINAQLQAKKGIQHVDVPPIRSTSTPKQEDAGDIYTQDGDYIRDIEVNDLRNRYTLTKGATQKMIKELSGADVTTRGEYYPDKTMATPNAPPLYLHITSQSKDGLEKAVKKIEELMTQELPNLVDERRFRRREPETNVERDEFGRRKWPEERIPIDLEPIPGFNLRAQVVGAGGQYVKYIQGKTKCRVQIKGRGSGFTEHGSGRESDEPMYLHVAGPDPAMVELAKTECIELLDSVKKQYDTFKSHGSGYNRGDGGGRVDQHGGGRGPPGRPERSDSYGGGGYQNGGYNQQSYGGQQSPPGHAISPVQAAPAGEDYSAQWAAYYAQGGAADPYAAYGGYDAYVQYAAYYQQYGAPGADGATPGAPATPMPPSGDAYGQAPPPAAPPAGYDAQAYQPPPPPGGAPGGYDSQAYQPPPPPPGAGGYGAVPPPPGM
ncbi:KH domain protein [Venturia nashicola]|uniref:KH domain protein n=1 Tax=Venturia nashicola TaxID=86259 RepID=A0A4Z1NSV5_9PEZI|nr:KH domain protein [Venturia nashicola]